MERARQAWVMDFLCKLDDCCVLGSGLSKARRSYEHKRVSVSTLANLNIRMSARDAK